MNIETAKQHIGKMVMSLDAGDKMIYEVAKPHGPYRILKITKAGMAILEGREDERIRPSLLVEMNTREVLFINGPMAGRVLSFSRQYPKWTFWGIDKNKERIHYTYTIRQENGEWIGEME